MHVISNHITTMLEILMIILAIYGYELAHVNVNVHVHVTMKTQFIVSWVMKFFFMAHRVIRFPQGLMYIHVL